MSVRHRASRTGRRLAAALLAAALLAGCVPDEGEPPEEDGPEDPEDRAPGVEQHDDPEPAPGPAPDLDRAPEEGEEVPVGPDQPVSHGFELRRGHVGLPEDWSGEPSVQIVSSHDGQVIQNVEVDVSGLDEAAAIDVRHDDVTVRHVRVHHRDGRNGVRFGGDTAGGRVEFSEFYGHYRDEPAGNIGSVGVVGEGPVEVYRNYFEGGRDGVRVEHGHTEVVENWVENLHPNPGAHNDGFAHLGGDDGGIVFARNRTVEGNSGGIDLYAVTGPVQNVRIVDNLIVGVGVGFGIYGGRTGEQAIENRGVQIEGNRFIGEFAHNPTVGHGSNAGVDLTRPGNTFENNRWMGAPFDLPARCGIRRPECE